jgi:hypothetical protein
VLLVKQSYQVVVNHAIWLAQCAQEELLSTIVQYVLLVSPSVVRAVSEIAPLLLNITMGSTTRVKTAMLVVLLALEGWALIASHAQLVDTLV